MGLTDRLASPKVGGIRRPGNSKGAFRGAVEEELHAGKKTGAAELALLLIINGEGGTLTMGVTTVLTVRVFFRAGVELLELLGAVGLGEKEMGETEHGFAEFATDLTVRAFFESGKQHAETLSHAIELTCTCTFLRLKSCIINWLLHI